MEHIQKYSESRAVDPIFLHRQLHKYSVFLFNNQNIVNPFSLQRKRNIFSLTVHFIWQGNYNKNYSYSGGYNNFVFLLNNENIVISFTSQGKGNMLRSWFTWKEKYIRKYSYSGSDKNSLFLFNNKKHTCSLFKGNWKYIQP